MSQPMNPTSNVDFSHDAYMKEYKDQKFYGYKAHLAYLDYFIKTDVAMREGQLHGGVSGGHTQKQQPKPEQTEGGDGNSGAA
jgi:hypothetical protein